MAIKSTFLANGEDLKHQKCGLFPKNIMILVVINKNKYKKRWPRNELGSIAWKATMLTSAVTSPVT